MDFAFTTEAGLAGLFLASFPSATLLPSRLGSDACRLLADPSGAGAGGPAAGTIGNTAGGMLTYTM